MMLPPIADFEAVTGVGRLTVGDLQVDVIGRSGEILVCLVLSAVIELVAETSAAGEVVLTTSTSRISSQILEQSPSLPTPLTSAIIAAIAEFAIQELAARADDVLASLPVPGLPGASISSPTYRSASGYLRVTGQLAFD
jgi:hypothetical protein